MAAIDVRLVAIPHRTAYRRQDRRSARRTATNAVVTC